MSTQYPGGIVRAVPITPTGPYQNSAASGIWTLDQVAYWVKQSLWPTAGSVNPEVFIENLFSTYLYTGNNATQTITNGIDLAGSGGMIWFKPRSTAASHVVFDTVRGPTKFVVPNSSSFGEITNTVGNDLTSFNSNGFSLGPSQTSSVNVSGTTQVAWTFREKSKFFDVVTYTGNGVNGRTLTHNLGSVPGCVIIKRTDTTGNWTVWHRSLSGTYPSSRLYLQLNLTSEANGGSQTFTAAPTSTTLTFDDGSSGNGAGATYVAYLFAHDAGGFGLSGTENVISCGSCVSNGSGFIQPVNLGYEPQWVMLKRTNSAGGWIMLDTLRGMYNETSAASPILFANTTAAESGTGTQVNPTATGFQDTIWGGWGASNSYIYIAVRRGPMAVPTLGTRVFNAIARSGTGAAVTVTGAGFTPDWLFTKSRSNVTGSMVADRLRGTPYLQTNSTNEEAANTAVIDNTAFSTTMDGFRLSASSTLNNFVPYTYINYLFKRAPSFFDEVCYTGTGANRSIAHNLGVAPELILFKARSIGYGWWTPFGFSDPDRYSAMYLESSGGAIAGLNFFQYSGNYLRSQPSATSLSIGTNGEINQSGVTFVAYLFATCAGVSKVGGYTGTGTTQAINCGFTTGARFVLIKRTDSTGNWYYWDSTRGIVTGDDPYLLMNSTALEVTNTDYVDTSAAGFEISSTAPAEINASGGSYIFLAIS